MKNVVLILSKLEDLSNPYVDSFLIPVKNLSTRSILEYEINEILEIKKKTKKNVYFLCDKLIEQDEINLIEKVLEQIFRINGLVFFQDFALYEIAKKFNSIDQLVYYSPTLCVSYQDIEVLQELGIKSFIISKEASYKDYISILEKCSNLNLGMLSLGYPQIYYSKRKMVSSFQDKYDVTFEKNNLTVKEISRDFYQPIIEDQNGTYIFAGEVFFPYQHLKEFLSLGLKMFLIDPLFLSKNDLPFLVNQALLGNLNDVDFASNYLLFNEMENDYGK